ncbi:MAG: hypothetical protein K6L80_15585 [Agarilytica sp.]
MFPEVKDYGGFNPESFEEYYGRLTPDLKRVPKDVIEQWVHYHWQCFTEWMILSPHKWKYYLYHFKNKQVAEIDHIGDWISTLDAEGEEYVTGKPRSKSWLCQHMLKSGTFPRPIIVAKNAESFDHPRGLRGEKMKPGLQLIEGHCRLAILRGMINAKCKNLKAKHKIWLVEINA